MPTPPNDPDTQASHQAHAPLMGDELAAKYAAERDKRLRADGNAQYIEPVGTLSHFLDDPHRQVDGRAPFDDHVNVAVIGGGFAGLVTAARLRQAGVEGVRIIEKGSDVGGTWYWNRYPGAQCDTAAMIYLPLLEETGYVPTEKYTHGPEIAAHCRRIAEHFDLYDNAVFNTEVTALEWDDEAGYWHISTDRGDAMTARYVTIGPGPLHRPKLPAIEGIERFVGESFHTSRWDYDITGGDPDGAAMTGLNGRRVGIIGTGATAVQCIPHLARHAGDLFVFQRTPSSVDVRNNRPIDPEWFASLEPGWQQRWMDNFTLLQTGGIADEDLVEDGWTDIAQRIRAKLLASPNPDLSPDGLRAAYHASDDEKMSEIRERVDEIVADPATAAALKPWYRQLCKRPCFHDQYLQAFNRSNVHLVDTDGKGVDAITERGVVVNDVEYQLDVLIFASGFEVGTDFTRRWGFDVHGRDTSLSNYWAEGMRTLHGIHVYGFPNLFIVGAAQAANLISNIPHNLTEAATTIAQIIAHAEANNATQVEVVEAAQDEWVATLEAGGRTFGGDPSCTPGYYNNEGQPVTGTALRNSLAYPDGPVAYFDYINRWRADGDFAGLDFGGR